MKSLHLSISFALQSSTELRVSQRIEQERGLIALVEGRGYPASGTIGVGSLRPHRHYRVCGAAQGFCRATADGSVMIALSIDQPSLLVLTSVI
jgi:hypothetical protein